MSVPKVHYSAARGYSLCNRKVARKTSIADDVTCRRCLSALGINPDEKRYRVTDTKTGRTGYAISHGGYRVGGSYVNPSWVIRWDD